MDKALTEQEEAVLVLLKDGKRVVGKTATLRSLERRKLVDLGGTKPRLTAEGVRGMAFWFPLWTPPTE
jgi:hypothetical protein